MISVLSKIVSFNRINVIGIYFEDNNESYYVLTVKKVKNTLQILSGVKYSGFEELVTALDKKTPVVLQFDGKGILTKKLDGNNQADIAWYKNLDLSTIYFTEYKNATTRFVSFARRSNIYNHYIKISEAKFSVIDFFVGPLPSVLLKNLLDVNEFSAGGSVLLYNNEGQLVEVSRRLFDTIDYYSVSGESLSQHHIPLYGAGVAFFISPADLTKSMPDSISSEEITYKKSFNILALGLLVTVFVSLFISYLFIQHFLAENTILSEKSVYNNEAYQNIVNLEKQKKEKLDILQKTGQLSRHFLSFYVYEISGNVPEKIQFTDIDIFPVHGEVKQGKKVAQISKIILVKGSSTSGATLDEWFSTLVKLKWVNRFEIISIKKDKGGIQQFEIKITVKDV